MSIHSTQTEIDRINKSINDLEKKVVDKDKKRIKLEGEIVNLQKRVLSSTSTSTQQSYQRQISSKDSELNRVRTDITSLDKQINTKRSDLTRKNDTLSRKIRDEQRKEEQAVKKRRSEELAHLNKRERAVKNQVWQQQTLTRELSERSRLFSEQVAETFRDATPESESDYSLEELLNLHKRIDLILEKLNELGLGQSILFDEIEELKEKSKKISKKDIRLLTIGKLVSYGTSKLELSDVKEVFETITGVDLSGYLP